MSIIPAILSLIIFGVVVAVWRLMVALGNELDKNRKL